MKVEGCRIWKVLLLLDFSVSSLVDNKLGSNRETSTHKSVTNMNKILKEKFKDD